MDLRRAIVKLFSARVGNALLSFVGIVIFARILSPGELGVYFLFEASLGVLSLLADFGLRTALAKRMSEGDGQSAFLSSAVLLETCLLTVISVPLLLSSELVDGYIGANVTYLLVLTLGAQGYALLLTQSITGELRAGETAILHFTRRVVWFVLSLVLLGRGLGALAPMYGLLVGNTIMLLWALVRKQTSFGAPTLRAVRSLLGFGRYSLVGSVGGYVYSWVDVLVLGVFVTTTAVSQYEVAWRVSVLLLLAPQAMRSVLVPQISAWRSGDEWDKIGRTLSNAVVPAVVLAVPALFGVVLLGQGILRYVFGPEYVPAYAVLVILTAEKVQEAISKIYGTAVEAIDRPELAARAITASVVANIVLNVLLIPSFGILGAAIATTAASVLSTVLLVRYLIRYITISIPGKDIAWIGFSALVMAATIGGAKSIFEIRSIWALLGLISFGTGIYVITLFSAPRFRKEFRQTLTGIGNR